MESDLLDNQKEMEERALVLAEEKEQRTKTDKLSASTASKKGSSNKLGKSCPSPRESKKASLTSLNTAAATASPSSMHKITPSEYML